MILLETTLSGRTYLRLFNRLKAKGYSIHVFYLWIPSPELAISRIAERVLDGGHNVPEIDVRRRYSRTLNNLFDLYYPVLDSLLFFDNSREEPFLIFEEYIAPI